MKWTKKSESNLKTLNTKKEVINTSTNKDTTIKQSLKTNVSVIPNISKKQKSPKQNNQKTTKINLNKSISPKNSGSPNKIQLVPGTYQEILYTKPNKPLDFSFRDIIYMKDIINAVPRQGVSKQQNQIGDNNAQVNKSLLQQENDEILKDVSHSNQNKKKGKEVKEEIYEGKIFGDRSMENNKAKKRAENIAMSKVSNISTYEKITIQKIIRYLPYTNAIILHSNNIKSIYEIDAALNDVLPEVEFLNDKSTSNKNNTVNNNNNSLIPRGINYSKLDLLQWIDLSHNKIESVHKDILKIRYLKILYLHANFIKNLEEVRVLSNCKALINLTLHGNPIEHIKGYRLLVIEMIATLEKLDFTLVSEKELDIIHFKGARFGEKRLKTGEVVEFPQLDKEILKRMNIPINEETKEN